MSESNRNPDEIEEKPVELPEGWSDADFINEDEPAVEAELAPETPETPETPVTPETPETPTPRVPPLFAEVTDPAERKALIEDAIAALPPEERAGLKGVDELVRGAHAVGQQRGAQTAREQLESDGTEQQRIEAAETFIERAREFGSSPDFKWENEIANVEEYAGKQRQSVIVNAMSRGIGAAFREVGITDFPDSLKQRLNSVDPSNPANFAEVIYPYVQYALAIGVEGGKRLQSESQAAQSEADAIATRARLQNEALGNLAKNGRIRISRDAEGMFAALINDTPPVVTGDVPAGAVVVDEAEWELAMRDSDAYDRMMADPGKRAFIESLTAEAVGGRR